VYAGRELCSFGLSATSQQYFFLRTNQPPATSQQYFSLTTNQHQPSATNQTNMPHDATAHASGLRPEEEGDGKIVQSLLSEC
jgi:hypothetical protein